MPNDFLEKTLEDIIYENKKTISERGFPEILKCLKRQFVLPSGKKIDLLSWDIRGNYAHFKIFELKKDEVTEVTLWQAITYYNEILDLSVDYFSHVKVDVYLIGNSVSKKLKDLKLMGTDIFLYSYKYDYTGILFEETGISLKEAIDILQDEPYYVTPERLEFCSKLKDFVHRIQEYECPGEVCCP